MYSHCYTFFGLLALLASSAFAAPHDEDAPNSTAIPTTTAQSSGRTKTVIVTVTITDELTITDGLPSATSPAPDNPTYTSAFDVPPPPDSLNPPQEPDHSALTRSAPMIICPHPIEPCTISGISIWPSGTTSLVLSSFTYDPLPTSMASGIAPSGNGTLTTETLATSGSPTCAHSMSHFVPGKSKLPYSEPSYTNATMSATSSLSGASSVSVSTTCLHSMSHIVPGKSKIPDVPAPTYTSTSAPGSTSTTPISGIPTSISSPSSNTCTTCSHSMSHIVPNQSAASPPDPTSLGKPWSMLPITILNKSALPPSPEAGTASSSNDKHTPSASLSKPTYHPPRPSIEARDFFNSTTAVWKTQYIKHTKTRRAEENKAEPRRKTYWSRFFVIADIVPGKENVCLACDDEGRVTCLERGRYTWCKNGCLKVEKLGCDMVCDEGLIRREGNYCVK